VAATTEGGWSRLFESAFRSSRNAMLLVDDERAIVDTNGAFVKLVGRRRAELIGTPVHRLVVHGPQATPQEWAAALASERFSGETQLHAADGATATVQWGAETEVVTGRRLVLFVVMSTSRWGGRFRRSEAAAEPQSALSSREREIVALVAHGHSGPEIADELQITHNTVRTHVRNAMTKLGARSRAHLVAKALGEGHVFV
jgi:PAS domain S-box-containing protein